MSSDQDEDDHDGSMPWTQIPFGEDRIGQLREQFNVLGIPTVVFENNIINFNVKKLLKI